MRGWATRRRVGRATDRRCIEGQQRRRNATCAAVVEPSMSPRSSCWGATPGATERWNQGVRPERAAITLAPADRDAWVWKRARGSRTKGLLMAYKLLDMAQTRWRRLDGAHLLPLVRAGIGFVDGVQHEGKASKPRAKAA